MICGGIKWFDSWKGNWMRINKISRIGRNTLVALVGLVCLAEIGLRFTHVADFPVYLADNQIGYIPAPNQSGAFLGHNDWAFNELSMGTPAPFSPTENKTDILLVGDSIVLGGNPFRQVDKLGPQLEQLSGDSVWPISAGSWALQNEVQWLITHSNVTARVDHIVLVLNSADFGKPSSWRSELTHPRSHPVSVLQYVLNKYLLKPDQPPTPASLLVLPQDPFEMLSGFAATYSKPIDIWLYPKKAEFEAGERPSPELAEMADKLKSMPELSQVNLYFVSEIKGWSTGLYRDAIHPVPDGFHLFAQEIARHLN